MREERCKHGEGEGGRTGGRDRGEALRRQGGKEERGEGGGAFATVSGWVLRRNR